MAQVQYSEGVPDVAPRTEAPEDYQREQANPAEFGGLVAQGAEKAGQGALQAGKFFGEVAANSTWNDTNDQIQKVLHGDPNKPQLGPDGQPVVGPDGKPVPDAGYFGLKGSAALYARPNVEKQIDEILKGSRANLSTPEEQLYFDTISRRQRSYWSNDIGEYANRQQTGWYSDVNKSQITQNLGEITRYADDPVRSAHSINDLANAYVKEAQLNGTDQQAAVREGHAVGTEARIEAIAVNNPAAALRMVDDPNAKAVLGNRWAPLAERLRARGNQAIGVEKTMAHVNAIASGYQAPPLPAVTDAIFGQESGHGANTQTSVTGAVGYGQIEPATFRQFANPGQDINNRADNKAVGQRIIANYYQQYNGDPYRVAVAYFSGPGNVSPPGSPTPWLHDRADPTGKTVSSYVSDIAGRLGAKPSEAAIMPHAPLPQNDPYALNASAMQAIMNDDSMNEDQKQAAFTYLQRSFQHAQVAAEADVKAKKDANDTAANGYVSTMMKSGASPQMLTDIANNPNLTWETKENLQRIATQDFGLESTTQYGKAYADTYKRIFLPPDDPNRINDVNDILKLGIPGQDNGLTPRGVGELGKVFVASRKDPDQSAVNQTKASLLNYAKSLLSFDQESLIPGIPPLRDQKGVQAFDGEFVPRFEAFYDAQIKAGKDPWEILTKDNVDKIAQQIRPKSQVAADRIRAEGSLTGDQVDNAVPPQAPAGVSDETWAGLLKTPPTNQMTGRPASAKVYGDAILAVQQNADNAAYKNSFNKWFGAKGAMADDLLGKLGTAPGQSAPQAAPGAPIVVPQQTSATLPQPAAATDAETNFQKVRDEALEHLGAPHNVRAELLQQAHPLPQLPELGTGMELPGISQETAAWLSQPRTVRNVRTERLREGAPAQEHAPDPTFGMGPNFYRLDEAQQRRVREAYEAVIAAQRGNQAQAALQQNAGLH